MWFIRKKVNIPEFPGALPSPLDLRDIPLSAVKAIPARIAENYPPPFDLAILNQDGYPYCVGYGSAGLKQEKEMREKVSVIFDGDWIYKECKKIDDYSGPGTYLRIATKVLQKVGAKPLDEGEDLAFRYRIGGYARVDELSFEGLKRAIYVNGALLAGFTGSNQGWQSAYIRPPKSGEKTWGHAVLLIGYNKDYIIGQNSWGPNWGEKGLFYVPKDYLPFEAWAVLTDLPTEFLHSSLMGWAAVDYLRAEEFMIGNKVYPICRLNLRKEPAGEKITTLDKGQKCFVIGEAKKVENSPYNWVKIKVL